MRPMHIRFIVLIGFGAASMVVRTSGASQGTTSQDSAKTPQVSRGQKEVDVEGKWLITFVGPDGVNRTRILTLHRDKTALTGTLDAPVCPCAVSGSIKGDKLELRISPQNRKAVSTIYIAKVSGDTMNGESYLEGVNDPGSKFKGIRQAQNEPLPNPARN